jgi:galactose mutarotase-like enzyme
MRDMVTGSLMPNISTAFTYRGIDAAFVENDHLRILVLPGKGGDILEFRDKRTDVDVLWHADHNWVPPTERYVPAETSSTWLDHYPGGWQVNLPIAGTGMEIAGNAYGLHGESALLPWEASVTENTDDAVELTLTTELVRYPFALERVLRLPAGEPVLEVRESVTNVGGVELEYVWQQHVALGRPLLGPAARLDVPAETGVTEEVTPAFETGRLASERPFEWPHAPTRDGGTTDLRDVPPEEAAIHDQCYATDLEDGWYALTNPELDLGFAFTFPTDPFECVWYWQPLGGFEESPYWGRTYNVGLEPTTAYPVGGLPDAQRANDTMKMLAPGETVDARFTARTYGDADAVADVSPDGITEREG